MIIIINAFVLAPQIAIVPLFRLRRRWGMLGHMGARVIPSIALPFAWSILLVGNVLADLFNLRRQAALPVVSPQMAGPYDPHWNRHAAATVATMILPLLLFIVFQRVFSGACLIPGHAPARRTGVAKARPEAYRSASRFLRFARRPLPWRRSRQ